MTDVKTNVMRLLDQKKVPYQAHQYPHGNEALDGVTVAGLLGQDPDTVFKTLVARGASKTCYVFVIPAARELDLKKAARVVGEKSVAMLHVSELNGVTGYVRGGCSPLGMKKQLKTTLDASAQGLPAIVVSAGKIGYQVELAPEELARLTRGQFAAVTADG